MVKESYIAQINFDSKDSLIQKKKKVLIMPLHKKHEQWNRDSKTFNPLNYTQ